MVLRLLLAAMLGFILTGLLSSSVWADTPTPSTESIPTLGITPETTPVSVSPTAAPLATRNSLPAATPAPSPRSTPRVVKETHHKHAKRQVRKTSTPTPQTTPTTGPKSKKSRRKLHRKARKKATATPTATPSATPTATPALNLTADDSVAPVTCNGPNRPVISHPFLDPPYHGGTSIVSIFDHDSPNYYADGLTIATTGAVAAPDAVHHRTDFPAYWNSVLRQYLDYDGHNGYDYDLSYRSVFAAAAGKVIFAALEYPDNPQHGYGKMVMIDHHNGYVTLYGHFSQVLVQVGQKVRRGQKIGVSGNTGHSTGPHLHFTVFHNCTPTDPYGWSGIGPDPLESYKGENSINLWLYAPKITNPLPGWPGLAAARNVPGARRLLLKLPSTRLGAAQFERSLHRRAVRVSAALRRAGYHPHIDMLRGSVDLSASISASELYALPFVVSIESPDSVDGTKADVLAHVARAELSTNTRRQPLAHSGSWTGYLVPWAGRTVLVGQGSKGREVALRLPRGTHHTATERLYANLSNGLYAVDLGKLSKRQYRATALALRGTKPLPVRSVAAAHVPSVAALPSAAKVGSGPAVGWVLLPALLMFLVVGGTLFFRARWARPDESN